MTARQSLRVLRTTLLLAALAASLSECGSSSESESCIEDFQCPADKADLGQTCKPACGKEHTFCSYPDRCRDPDSRFGCFYPYECVDGKWEAGPICASLVSCPDAPPADGAECLCAEALSKPCVYGNCAAGDTNVITADCGHDKPDTWTVTTEPCP